MAVKFSEFVVETTNADVEYIVGYNGTDNVQITPSNFLSGQVPYTGATGNVNLGTYGLISDYSQLNTSPSSVPVTAGTIAWNDSDGTMDIKLKGGNVTLQVGQENVTRVVNKTGVNLLESQYRAVYISGSQGQRLKVDLALANNSVNSSATIGLVTENIDVNQEGFINTNGLVREINTTGSLQGETWLDGQTLYLSATVPGGLTNIAPIAPNHRVVMGYIVYAHGVHGTIYVKVSIGLSVAELNDVEAVVPLNNELLVYNSTTSVWQHKTIATILGYTPVPTTRTLTINGTTQDLSANRTWSVGTITGSGTGASYIPIYTGTTAIGTSQIYNQDNINFVGFGRTSQYSQERFGLNGGIYISNVDNADIMYVDDSTANNVFLVGSDGSVYNSTGTYGTVSDRILKENILPATSKLDDLMKVNIVNYNLIDDLSKTKQIGVIAQELEEIFPGLVTTNKDGIKSVKTSVMIPILIKAVQELKQLIK